MAEGEEVVGAAVAEYRARVHRGESDGVLRHRVHPAESHDQDTTWDGEPDKRRFDLVRVSHGAQWG